MDTETQAYPTDPKLEPPPSPMSAPVDDDWDRRPLCVLVLFPLALTSPVLSMAALGLTIYALPVPGLRPFVPPLSPGRDIILLLGAVVGDYALRRHPRALRWAVGMAATGPLLMLLDLVTYSGLDVLAAKLLEDGVHAGGAAIIGLVMAWAARTSKGLIWRLPVVGLVIQTGSAVALAMVAQSLALRPSIAPQSAWAWIAALFAVQLPGIVFGLCLAIGLRVKIRAPWERPGKAQ